MARLGTIINYLDSLFSWIERLNALPGVRVIIAIAGGLILAGLAWVRNRPFEDAVVIGLVGIASVFLILAYAPSAAARIMPFPFVISVPDIMETPTSVQIHAVILNRRPNDRVAIHVGLCLYDDSGGQCWITQATLSDIKLSLNPQEYTDGVITFGSFGPHDDMPAHKGCLLRAVDMISNRSAMFKIPGTYPPEARLQSINRPVFQVVKGTKATIKKEV